MVVDPRALVFTAQDAFDGLGPEGASLCGLCSRCQRQVDNHDPLHRVSAICRGGRGVECVVRGDISPHEAGPLGPAGTVAVSGKRFDVRSTGPDSLQVTVAGYGTDIIAHVTKDDDAPPYRWAAFKRCLIQAERSPDTTPLRTLAARSIAGSRPGSKERQLAEAVMLWVATAEGSGE